MSDPLNTQEIVRHYTAELFTSYAGQVRGVLTSPMTLECLMHVGGVYRALPFMGDEEFSLGSATVKGKRVYLRFAPKLRQEFAYIEIPLEPHGEYMDVWIAGSESKKMSLRQLHKLLLAQKEPNTGLTFDQVIAGAVRVETQKHMQEQIGSHDNFGTW